MRIVMPFILVLGACATAAAEYRMEQLHKELDHLKGKSAEGEIAHAWGPPESRDSIGGIDYWIYHRSYGTGEHGSRGVYETQSSAPITRSTTRYDRIILEFNGGVFRDWRAEMEH